MNYEKCMDYLLVCKRCGSLCYTTSSYKGLMRTTSWCPACTGEPVRRVFVLDEAYEAKRLRKEL